MDTSDIVVIRAVVEGNVQGVFFRATARDHARYVGIQGTVRNASDGTVEIYAKGTKKQVDHFLSRLKEEPGMGSVSSIDVEYLEGNYPFEGFKVVY